jgi:hypothetical protein
MGPEKIKRGTAYYTTMTPDGLIQAMYWVRPI